MNLHFPNSSHIYVGPTFELWHCRLLTLVCGRFPATFQVSLLNAAWKNYG